VTPDLEHAHRLARGEAAAVAVFAYCRAGLHAAVGSLLTTASVYDLSEMRSRRVWTDDAAAYPTGNFKRLDRNLYFETVIERCEPYASTSIEGIQKVFFDWQKIQALGFESNMNLPAVADGQVIGTLNLLHRKGHFTADKVEAALAWQPVATLAFLLLDRMRSEGANFHGVSGGGGAPAMEG
jgi:hypothetical protein